MVDRLTESNFLLYAAKHYDNPQCFDTVEFYEDLNRFKYIKRLFNNYIIKQDLKERLILNHIIALNNVFGPHATLQMLFLRLRGYERYLKPFLIMLNIMPEKIEIGDTILYSADIPMDQNIINALRKV
jgi:hypothetical protein